jgi:hypothetical protein
MISRNLIRLGAVAAFLAAVQPWALLVIGDVDASSLGALAAQSSARWHVSLWLMLLFVPLMFAAYLAVASALWYEHPPTAALAIAAFCLWFLLEVGLRSIDLFTVAGRWVPAYLAGTSADRALIEHSYRVYGDVSFGLIFVRRHALLLAQLLLASLLPRTGRLGVVLSVLLGLSALRLSLGTLSTYCGLHSLARISDPLYFITAGLVFPILGIWLLHQQGTANPTPPGATA